MTRDVLLREVGLRDGLQSHEVFVGTDVKLDWIRREAAAGISEIEVTSFVPARLIPQFADSEHVVSGALTVPGLTVTALVPNRRGAERGMDVGVHKLNFVMSVSGTHSRENVRRSPEDSLIDFRAIVNEVRSRGVGRRPTLSASLATAFGCSYEGRIRVEDVVRYAVALAEAGAEELTVADTVGYADPAQVRRVFKAILAETGPLPIVAHFHDTRGTGLANVIAALDCGIAAFDASLGGLGGCQFAPGASGNIVMEDLCFMLDSMGVTTGIDVEKLLEVRRAVAMHLQGFPLTGALAMAGLPTNYQSAVGQARVQN